MSTLNGTVTDVKLETADPTGSAVRKTYRVICQFTQNFTSGDIAQIPSCDTKIQNIVQNGKTFTVRDCSIGDSNGYDASGTAVFAVRPVTNTSGTITFGLGGTTTTAACTGTTYAVSILVIGDDS
jgi:hypothetical protein